MNNRTKNILDYREKVMGCWLGKAVGGTLGMPMEGEEGPFNLHFYDPLPHGMVENDDLDLQILWATLFSNMKVPLVHRNAFVEGWRDNVQFPWDEYGVAKRNIAEGLIPPLTGSYDNWYYDGMGAAIRSELWACLAPGDPRTAALFAYEDACVDHDKNGIYAEVFLAALESAAFVCTGIDKLLNIGLSYVPSSSKVFSVVEDTRSWWAECGRLQVVRDRLIEKYGSDNFTDVVINLSFIVLGLLAGNREFGRSICAAANCGKDTDCTAATVGSILGIMNPNGIEKKWLTPIGKDIVLSKAIVGVDAPKTIDDFTDMIIRLAQRITVNDTAQLPESINVFAMKDLSFYIDMAQCSAEIFGAGYQTKDAVPLPQHSSFVPFSVPGTIVQIESSVFAHKPLLFRYTFILRDDRNVRVMFNTQENCRVWIDGNYAFGRECGRMSPSFHRVPINQYQDMMLSVGRHELIAVIDSPPVHRKEVEWVVGIGDFETKQWIPGVFRS